jgi:hypothetical protein
MHTQIKRGEYESTCNQDHLMGVQLISLTRDECENVLSRVDEGSKPDRRMLDEFHRIASISAFGPLVERINTGYA